MHLRAFLLALLVLTQILLGGLIGHGVLCIEPDGALRVEHDGSLCCDREEQGPASEDGPVIGADCCACIDVALPSELDRSVVKTSDPVKLVPCVLPTMQRVWSLAEVSVSHRPRSVAEETPADSPFRSSFLRC